VLFDNAAMAYFNWLEDISDKEWDRNRREEVDLVNYLTRAAWPYLKASHGVVVNTASLTALISFKNTGTLAHTTAKAGIIGMTWQLAMEGRKAASVGFAPIRFRLERSKQTRRANS
jgi:NAD(P)-dependent dehydrogenase (short-subunit alcohol dehydrogenase family)